MHSINRALATGATYAPVLLRVFLGAYLLWHGIDKFDTGLSNVEGFFRSQGVPLPGLTAPFTAVAEIVIGLALIVGFGTRIAALAQVLILFGALIFVHWSPVGEAGIIAGSEKDLLYIAALVTVMLLGPGLFSVDKAMKLDDTVIDVRSESPMGVNA